jgi:hypothetical protein
MGILSEAFARLKLHSRKHRAVRVRWVLGLDIEEAGPVVHSRMTGAFEGIRFKLPNIPDESLVRMDGRGLREKSYRLVLVLLPYYRAYHYCVNDFSTDFLIETFALLHRCAIICAAQAGAPTGSKAPPPHSAPPS